MSYELFEAMMMVVAFLAVAAWMVIYLFGRAVEYGDGDYDRFNGRHG